MYAFSLKFWHLLLGYRATTCHRAGGTFLLLRERYDIFDRDACGRSVNISFKKRGTFSEVISCRNRVEMLMQIVSLSGCRVCISKTIAVFLRADDIRLARVCYLCFCFCPPFYLLMVWGRFFLGAKLEFEHIGLGGCFTIRGVFELPPPLTQR